jgi:Glycosyl hydrolase family 26
MNEPIQPDKSFTRREFLKSTAGVTGLALSGLAINPFGANSALAAEAPAPAAPSADPITPNSSPEVKVVLKYIQQNFGKKILAAQHGGQLSRATYVFNTTGKYPAIWGTDLISRARDDNNFAFVTDVWKRGAIPTIMWHWGAPTKGDGYEQSKSTIDVNQCFKEGTPEYTAMWVDLKSRADFLTRLRDAHVPVIWRPMHECSGGWFWWDKSGGEPFKKLWKTMYDYFTKDRGLNNLIWVLGFCGNPKAAYYTGEGTYDIIGGDTYGGTGPWASLYNNVKSIGGTKTPICLHECGTPPVPDQCQSQNAMWSWFMVWDSFIQRVDKTLLKNVYTSDLVLTLDKLPKFPA